VVTAAAGRGYVQSHNADNVDILQTLQTGTADVVPEASNLVFNSIFHRLGATAEALQTYVEGDDQVASWLPSIEDESKKLYELLAHNRVDEALANWESLEVSRLANLLLPRLPWRAAETNLTDLWTIADELGYELTPKEKQPATGATAEPAP
jgi:hypothetical protein